MRGERPIITIALAFTLQFPSPNVKCKLKLPGIKSTLGVTYHRSTNKVINHIFPDVDRTVGIELTKVVKSEYPEDLLRKPYKEFSGDTISVRTIKGQENQRKKWGKKIAQKIAQQL